MKAERWHRVDELFHAALARAGEERSAFLREACGGDDELRKEVEALIAAHEQEGSFIDSPAFVVTPQPTESDQAESLVGQQVSRYEVLSLLGRGGMGEVYLARDPRLGRRVALKLLPKEFAQDADRLQRFEQEARAASALNHPNIITIHEIGTVEGVHFIATEYIDGQTLRQTMTSVKLKLHEVLDVAMQVASALSAAHAAGIVHRDIKPENVMVRPDNLVKVLDFGLAKLTESPSSPIDTNAPTPPLGTTPGMVMGTLRYMSPEQARGQKVDARSDIFSLGVVLYEMLAGQSPFAGATTADVIAAIIGQEPLPITHYLPEAPEALERIIAWSLRKDREERYVSAREMLTDLKGLKQRLELEAQPERPSGDPTRRDQSAARRSAHAVFARTTCRHKSPR